jgi:thiol-disulfide isomerase/thioredoxin
MQTARWPVFVAFALFLSACSRSPSTAASDTPTTSAPPAASPAPSTPAPDTQSPSVPSAPAWTLKDLDGKTVSLADFKGKVVVLDFWATWCPPCRAEIPHFIELQNELKDKGVTIVGVSLDSTGPADVAQFAKTNGMNYPIVMGDEKTATAYGADQGIPTTVVIDAKGNIVATHLGLTDKDTFESDIKKALAE